MEKRSMTLEGGKEKEWWRNGENEGMEGMEKW